MVKYRDSLPKFSFRKLAASIGSAAVVASFLVLSPVAPANAAACGLGTAPTAGDGSSLNPYRVATAANLIWVADRPAEWTGKYFVQTADVDLMGCDWNPIGNSSTKFTGSYDGQGHTVDGLFFRGAGFEVGLFGWVNPGGAIANVGVINAILDPTGDNVGAVVGNLNGSVTASFSSGTVSGIRSVGGLVGFVGATGSITDSYSTASATAPDSVGYHTAGGLVGFLTAEALVTNSWSSGAVVGDVFGVEPGGLIGVSDDSRNVTSSFWDTLTSLQVSSAGGTPKTTAEMTLFSTFSAATWKIVPGWQAFDAATRVWGMCSGVNSGYPFLLWQYDADPCASSGGSPGGEQTAPPAPAPPQLAATGVGDVSMLAGGAVTLLLVMVGAVFVSGRRRLGQSGANAG